MSSAGISSQATGDTVFRLAVASSTRGMAIVDREGRWREANPALERMLGRGVAELAGTAVAAAVAGEDAQALLDALGALAGGGQPAHLSLAFVHADGHEVPVRASLAPMRDATGAVQFVVLDIQDDETALVARELARVRAELAALHGLQASFAHGVSHDLRAPLRAIDSFSALLATHLDGGLDDTSRDYISRIRGASARMAELIDALLELSRAMRAELRQAPVDIGLLVDWAHAELADTDTGRDAQIDVQPGLQAWGDERQLRLLVTHLLHNAWKFSRDRDRVHVEVGGEPRADRIVVHVRDHGSGFDMRYSDKLFEPFQRLHGPEQAGGNGLGLAIVRCVAERHGGRVWAQSEPGAGSTFFVELPAVPDSGNRA